jgi:hypothetical protein
MSHYCEAALITCEDFRLHQRKDGRNYIAQFIKELGVDCDLITRGGGVQDMVRPREQGYRDCLLRDTQVSVKLHEADTIYLVNHEDCGAYGDMDFSSRDEEIEQHYKDLRKAREIILENFPDKTVKLYFFELKERPDVFEAKFIE